MKIIQENNLAFLHDESEISVKNNCLTPDKLSKELSTISPTLYLHMNISSLFFKLGFTPCKAEQPIWGMELQQKEAQKD